MTAETSGLSASDSIEFQVKLRNSTGIATEWSGSSTLGAYTIGSSTTPEALIPEFSGTTLTPGDFNNINTGNRQILQWRIRLATYDTTLDQWGPWQTPAQSSSFAEEYITVSSDRVYPFANGDFECRMNSNLSVTTLQAIEGGVGSNDIRVQSALRNSVGWSEWSQNLYLAWDGQS